MAHGIGGKTIDGESFLEGKLLIALPGMGDPRFAQSVIYMCAHSLETGAMGLCINRAIDGLGFRDMAQRLKLDIGPQTPDFPILLGGPVDTERGFVLHSPDYESPDSTLTIGEQIRLTATLDILRAIASGTGPAHALFVLGYAGWREGQIEDEIRANAWVHCDADETLLFHTPLERKWSGALAKLGIDISALSAHTGRA